MMDITVTSLCLPKEDLVGICQGGYEQFRFVRRGYIAVEQEEKEDERATC